MLHCNRLSLAILDTFQPFHEDLDGSAIPARSVSLRLSEVRSQMLDDALLDTSPGSFLEVLSINDWNREFDFSCECSMRYLDESPNVHHETMEPLAGF